MRHESEGGWSIWYPSQWQVLTEETNSLALLSDSDSPAVFVVGLALDAVDVDTGSLDYIRGNANFSVDDGLLRSFEPEGWFHLDLDRNGEPGPLDIYGFELDFAKDPATGDPIGEENVAPTWWYGYYNPDARPDIGFIFQIFGHDPAAYQIVDLVVLSFEPPGGISGLSG